MATSAVRTQNLSRFAPGEGPAVLQAVSLEVPEGSLFGLLGGNGAGKSTLLRLLMGLAPIGAGEAEIFGIKVPDRASRAGVGYLPDQADILPGLTGREHLELYARLEGIPARERAERVQQALEEQALLEVADRPAHLLSKGTRQRVELARLFLVPRRLYLLDEPLTALDALQQEILEERLRTVTEAGATVLWTSHNYHTLTHLSSHVAVLNQGRLVQAGPTEEILGGRSRKEVLAAIGAPPSTPEAPFMPQSEEVQP